MTTRTPFATRRTVFAVAVAAAIGVSSLHAPAALAEDIAPQRVVSFADLDLASGDGVAALYERLQSAARAVCSQLQGREAAQIQRYGQCRDKALNDAVRQVNERTLTALHYASTPRIARGSQNTAG